MSNQFSTSRRAALLLALCAGLALPQLVGCKKDSEDNPAPAADGTVSWTHNGTSYTATLGASAVQDSDTSLLITAGSADNNNIVSLRLRRIWKTGAGVYQLRRGSVLNNYSLAGLLLNGNNTNGSGTTFTTLYGPTSPANGTITVSEYGRAGQRVAGTFSFVAGALPNTTATGTQTVTNGSFRFTKFR